MMRSGLFWKTLAAFWATLTILGVALTLYYDAQPGQDRPSDRFAPSLLAVLGKRLEEGGPAAAERDRGLLARSVGSSISIKPVAAGDARREGALIRRATAPDGRKYAIEFRRRELGLVERLPWRTIWGSLVAGLMFSVAFALSLSRPISTIRKGFRRLADGELDVELDKAILRRKDEFAHLAQDFNRMTQRLRALVGARDRLLHDVSHELRSPLTRLQLAIGLARQDPAQRDASIERVEEEARKLERLVDELLTLARAESGSEHSHEFFDPISAISSVIEDGRLEADAKGVVIELADIQVDEEHRPAVEGSAALLQRAFENLLRNAIRFSPREGRILVDAELLAGPPRYRIRVEDTGPGVDPTLLNSLLDPFVRSGPEGTGLGLAIADRAARALGGSLECRNGAHRGFIAQIELAAVPL